MKQLFVLLLLMLLPLPAGAQPNRGLQLSQIADNQIRSRRSAGGIGVGRNEKKLKTKEVQFQSVYIDNQTTLLVDNEGLFLYLGNIGKLNNGKQFPHGEGLCRTVIIDPDTGDSAYEYCLCPWKRGSRHGEGVIKHPDGTYRKARWKWNRLKSVSDESPTPEEIESLEKKIDRLERILQIL